MTPDLRPFEVIRAFWDEMLNLQGEEVFPVEYLTNEEEGL